MSVSCNRIAFLFDLDGVIIDSEKEYTKIWNTIEKEFPTGIPEFPKVIKGTTLTNILNTYYSDSIIRNKVKNRLHELEENMHYEYLPHAKEFLIELKKRNLPCALVTSSDNKKMSHLREEIPELESYFNYIVTGNIIKKSKPDPEGYLIAAEHLYAKPQNCVVFEDSLQGVIAGKTSGSYVVGICGTISPEILRPYCHTLINHFKELDLEDLILKLNEQ
ncbi:MAG: HAD family phosphatase [Muribaculaceae bacterium]|nr:HAD family phosphatase [Muribaculaceae bacterium]